jgi:histidinol-phosphate aminotransferase
MILRTFSKAHGLAGLRVGYMIVSEPLQKQLHKLTTVCNVNLVAHEIAKLAIKDEKGFINQVYNLNKKARDLLCKHLDVLGIRYPKSQASFVLLNMDKLAPQVPAIHQRLEEEDNIAVRIVKEKGEPYHLRVSIGTIGDMQAFISAFKKPLIFLTFK